MSATTVVCNGLTYLFAAGSLNQVAAPADAVVIQRPLFPDDTLRTVCQKLTETIPGLEGVNPTADLYLWARSPVVDLEGQGTSFALNLLRNRPVVHREEAIRTFANLAAGAELRVSTSAEMLRLADVMKAVQASTWKWVDEPGTVKYLDGQHHAYLPPNPLALRITPRQLEQLDRPYEKVICEDALLESLGGGVIHVCTRAGVRELLDSFRASEPTRNLVMQTYFPLSDTSSSSAMISMAALGKQDNTVADALYHRHQENGLSYESHLTKVSFLHNARVVDASAPEQAAGMRSVFYGFGMSMQVPYLFFADGTGALHRVHRRSFSRDGSVAHTMSVSVLRTWMDDCAKRAQSLVSRGDQVLFAYALRGGLVVQVTSALACTLTFSFPPHDGASFENVAMTLPVVNSVMASLRAAGLTHMTNVDAEFLRGKEPGQVFEFRNDGRLTSKRATPRIDALVAAVERHMQCVFFVVPGPVSSVLQLQYKRSANYVERNALNAFFQQYANALDPEELLSQLQSSFGIDGDAAVQAIAEWETHRKSEVLRFGRTTASRRYWEGVQISIRRSPDASGLLCVVKGVDGHAQAARIGNALCALLHYATGGVSAAPPRPSNKHASIVVASKDVDSDLLAELQKEIDTGVDAETTEAPAPLPSSSRKFSLQALQMADPRMFSVGAYATTCSHTAQRQPVVLSRADKARIDKLFPGSKMDGIYHGSTAELASRNFYVCPYAWCPKSRIAMSKDQFERLGKRCPLPDVQEAPVVIDSPYFEHRERHVGLLDPTTHPEGLAMPCCFKQQNKAAATNADMRYIRTAKFPAQQGRYALLPPGMSALFNGRCGSRPDGSGLASHNSDCLVRMGMPVSTEQPFLACVAQLLGVDAPGTLGERLANALDMETFLSLNGGATCRLFMDAPPKGRPAFRTFAHWLTAPAQQPYCTRFRLDHVVAELRKDPTRSVSDQSTREFALYCALQSFKDYILDPSSVKTPDNLLDLIGKQNGQILLFDVAEDMTVTLACRQLNALTTETNSIVRIIVRRAHIFEPVYWLRMRAGSGGQRLEAIASIRLPARTLAFLAAQQQECWKEAVTPLQLAATLRVVGMRVVDQVVDAYHGLLGFLVKNRSSAGPTAFVPLPTGWGIDSRFPGGVRYAPDAWKQVGVNRAAVLDLLAAVRRMLGDYYRVSVADPSMLLRLRDGAVVPTKDTAQRLVDDGVLDSRIATATDIADARTMWLTDQVRRDKIHSEASRLLRSTINKSPLVQEKLYYLRHPMNPLPLDVRIKQLHALLTDAVANSKLSQRAPVAALRRILLGIPDAAAPYTEASLDDDDVVIMQHQVSNLSRNGELFALIRTPETTTDLDVDRVLRESSYELLDVYATKGHALAVAMGFVKHPHHKTGMQIYYLAPPPTLAPGPGAGPAEDSDNKKCSRPVCSVLCAALNAANPGLRMTPDRLARVMEVYMRQSFAQGKGPAIWSGLQRRSAAPLPSLQEALAMTSDPCRDFDNPLLVRAVCDLLDLPVRFLPAKDSGSDVERRRPTLCLWVGKGVVKGFATPTATDNLLST